MAPSRRLSNGRSPIVNQQRQITAFFTKTTSSSPSPSPTLSKQNSKFSSSVPNPNPSSTPNSSPSPTTPSPFQTRSKNKPLLVISASPLTPNDKRSYGDDVVGKRIRVFWPLDKAWYEGTVKSFDKVANKHLVQYEDEEEELLDLEKEKFEWVQETLKRFKRLRRGALDSSEAVEIVEEEKDKAVQRRRGEDGDDSSDEDWGKNEEVMDLDEEEEEDVVKRSKGRRGEKWKRKASEGEKLGSAKKNKGGFKFSLVEPTSNNAESK